MSHAHTRPKMNRNSSHTGSVTGSTRYEVAAPPYSQTSTPLSYSKSLASRGSRSKMRNRTTSHSSRPLLVHDTMPVSSSEPVPPLPRRRHKSSSSSTGTPRPDLQHIPSEYYSQAGSFGKATEMQHRPSYGVLRRNGTMVPSSRQPLAGLFGHSSNKLPQPPSLTPNAPSSHNGSDYSTKSAMKSKKRPALRRAPSTVHFQPDHIFMSLPSARSLKLTNLPDVSIRTALQNAVTPLWSRGTTVSREDRNSFELEFGGGGNAGAGPWAARGNEGVMATRILLRVFETLARKGFSFLCTTSPPSTGRLIFTSAPADSSSQFFAIAVSRDSSTLRIIDAPNDVTDAIARVARNTCRREELGPVGEKDSSRARREDLYDGWAGPGNYEIQMRPQPSKKRGLGALFTPSAPFTDADADDLASSLAHILKTVSAHGFRLEAAVPLVATRSGFFASLLGGHSGGPGSSSVGAELSRELLVFRSVGWFTGGAGLQ
ncbi:hypothetical protein RSOLAG1IB_02552 [Rhizoctonia solani AG-1 IB]|uniref:Uncharacterized protein n=2 Tax=Rhizoctonia solani TaxID=456999 RepID=M5BL92_THACB|nr:unnamed protein product [Rhizoctonia solani]CCO26965.1 hypothetical protein BN14_00998 [Rhizoctonia solani AG-1 IB]CEL57808.1 hypothetical protein RSOLAG1IB_02552 [Rhizoctonia solani AG-1 IB]